MDQKEIMSFYILSSIPYIGNKTIIRLIDKYKTAENILNLPISKLEQDLSKRQFESFKENYKSSKFSYKYENIRRNGISFIPYTSDKYPSKLKKIPDPPAFLYVKGKLPDENKKSVAIVGARMCSEYGRYIARTYATTLARSGVQIISGMAMGVDSISQKGTLDVAGSTFAVLGNGVDICYPPENIDIYNKIPENGGIISEYYPGTQPKASLFPPRNRIISGLCDILLVVEARKRSGTQITVDMALEQGKEIFAIPGRVTDKLSDGCNELIKQGAGIALSPYDILESLEDICAHRSVYDKDVCENNEKTNSDLTYLNDMERAILDVIDIYPLSSSSIIEKLTQKGLDYQTRDILTTLTMMNIKGLIKSEGNYYSKKM